MISKCYTVAFEGIDVRLVEVQCALSPGLPAFSIVGLPDKAVSESRERVRNAISHLSIALPSKRITINLSPADLPKVGSHFDLPIALALLAAIGALPIDEVERSVAMGELSLAGDLVSVTGCLPAAFSAQANHCRLICPIRAGQKPLGLAKLRLLRQKRSLNVLHILTVIQSCPLQFPAK
jgi:magnesium chelatase family protein